MSEEASSFKFTYIFAAMQDMENVLLCYLVPVCAKDTTLQGYKIVSASIT
jgi:hypothetical protein